MDNKSSYVSVDKREMPIAGLTCAGNCAYDWTLKKPEHEPRVILATGSYIGEGFDDARLDTLFLAMPIWWKGTLQQYVGRLHRLHDNKRVVKVYDYVDDWVPMLEPMYERRMKGYGAIGYTIDRETPAAVA